MAMKFDWSGPAIRYTLGMRDRFLKHDITTELEANPLHNSVLIDPALNLYTSNVSNKRYMVVWQLHPEENLVKVHFVVPMQYWTKEPALLKQKVGRVLIADTDGRFTMKSLGLETETVEASPASAKPKPRPFIL